MTVSDPKADDVPGVSILVRPAYVRMGDGTEHPKNLLTKEPSVRRYNDWGWWAPLVLGSMPSPELMRFEPEVAAALQYRSACDCEGIEFVLLTTHRDDARFRTLPSGVIVVPVDDPDWPRDGLPSKGMWGPNYFLYDGWIPVAEDGPDAARAAIATLEDIFDFFAYQYGVRVHWMVKYAENFASSKGPEKRTTGDEDDALFRDRLSRLRDLPPPVQAAVQRAAHWHHTHERQERRSDRFLALWLAFESLALLLFEEGGGLGLVIVNDEAGLSKRQRKKVRDARVEAILGAMSDVAASDRVTRAYFDGIVGIRRRVEAVLRAVFGSDDHATWLYVSDNVPAPSDLRSKIVHDGWSEFEVLRAVRLDEYCRRLSLLLKELIERILYRNWGGPQELRRRTYERSISVENGAVGASAVFVGDFRISLGLLLRKNVIGVV